MSRMLAWKWRRRAKRALQRAGTVLVPPRERLPIDWVAVMDRAVTGGLWRDHFNGRRATHWLWRPMEWQDIADWIVSRRPDAAAMIGEQADIAATRCVTILGHGPVHLAEDYDWVTDPISRRQWPRCRAEWIPVVLDDSRSDIKHLWEIARFQFAPALGAAFCLTHDHRYALSLRDWIDDFLAKNPYGYGPHWINPMEAAIRAVNWIVAWSLCTPSPQWDEGFVQRFIGAIITHGRFIAAHLERDRRGINTNHYIADLVGLYAIATFVPEWPEASQWRALARTELLAESAVQILPDGFCYESSFGYHRLAFDMWFLFWRLATQQGEERLEELAAALMRMASFSLWNADRNGHLPAFGDGDDGRLVYWQARPPADHSPVWDMAEGAFGILPGPHPDGANLPSVDVLWLLGVSAYERLASGRRRRLEAACPAEQTTERGPRRNPDRPNAAGAPPVSRSRRFEHAQIAVMRSDRWLVHAFANPVGSGGVGGHKHNDMLSFTATLDGSPIIIDPGTFAYTADPRLRNLLRSTSAHATVVVDGADQNRIVNGQLFFLRRDATPEMALLETTPERDRLVMRHDGYRRLPPEVFVEREILLDRITEMVTIIDRLTGGGAHHVEVVLPLGDMAARVTGRTRVTLANEAGLCSELGLTGPGDWTLSVVPGWRSDAYGAKRGHRRLVFRANLKLPVEWTITLAPSSATRSAELEGGARRGAYRTKSDVVRERFAESHRVSLAVEVSA